MSSQERPHPPQTQEQPGREHRMHPEPVVIRGYRGSGKLEGKVALISGGDSGIGRAVAVHFAREGADVAIIHREEDTDARQTRQMVEDEGRRCLVIRADLSRAGTAREAVDRTVRELGRLDILVNNAGEQHTVERPEELDREQFEQTFRTNVFAGLELIDAALEHLGEGASIISTGSITGARGHAELIDYAGTKGAIHALTFSFAQRWPGAASVSTRSRRGRSGRPDPGQFSMPTRWPNSSRHPLGRPGQPAEVARPMSCWPARRRLHHRPGHPRQWRRYMGD